MSDNPLSRLPTTLGPVGGAFRRTAANPLMTRLRNRLMGPRPEPQPVAAEFTPPTTRLAAAQAVPNFPLAEAGRISTRIPTSKKLTDNPHLNADLEVGLESSRASPEAWAKNAELIRNYQHGNFQGDDNEAHEAFINHLRDNLLWLHKKAEEDLPGSRERARLWYDGAHAIARRWQGFYQISHSQAAGVLAALSPQKDWFQNVSLAKRILDLHRKAPFTGVSPEMQARMEAFVAGPKRAEARQALREHVDAIGTRTLRQLTDPMQRAIWIRAYDEAHNPRHYRLVTPEGEFGEPARTKSGELNSVAFGSFKEISKALGVLENGSAESISRLMGSNHKVRNFYNNIIAPRFGRDVTIDTHAIAAANLMPLGGKHELVKHGLGLGGAASSALTGSKGLYGVYAEAYRRAAKQLKMTPRELQSITWEAVRGLYSPEQKRDRNFVAAIDNIWGAHARGEISAAIARRRVHKLAGGIRAPSWHGSDSEDDAAEESAAE